MWGRDAGTINGIKIDNLHYLNQEFFNGIKNMNTLFATSEKKRTWAEAVRAFFHPRVIAMLFLGFSAGVPILLIFSTLSVWLREADVARSTIGFFSWAALGYGFKFVWAPLVDKMPLPLLARVLGQRRSWLLLSQMAIMAALCFMALSEPTTSLTAIAVGAVALGFSSATQDIVIDAYRIEAASKELQGLMSATYIAGYRLGMVVAGAGALELAGFLDVVDGYDPNSWRLTYFAMATVMLVGVVTTFVINEPERKNANDINLQTMNDYMRFLGVFVVAASAFVSVFFISADWAVSSKATLGTNAILNAELAGFLVEAFRLLCGVGAGAIAAWALVAFKFIPKKMISETYLAPFTDFFNRYGKSALIVIALIATYRIADVVMGVMANVFYVDLGYEKQEIGRITKLFGLTMTIAGGFLGGVLTVRYGVMKILFLGAVLAGATNLLFSLLAGIGPNLWALAGVISADNLSAGIASAAFVAYLSSLTSTSFTATQYALFSSIMVLLPKLIAGYSGMMVENVGYSVFFIGTAVVGILPLTLIVLSARIRARE